MRARTRNPPQISESRNRRGGPDTLEQGSGLVRVRVRVRDHGPGVVQCPAPARLAGRGELEAPA